MTNALVSTNNSSSSSSTASSSVLRITGMASGIDTDAVVKSMVSSYQTKIDKANQQEQTLQWKQDAYRDIIKGVKGLQDYFDPLSSKYILSGNTLNINSATNSDSSKFSATATSSAKTGTYTVNTTQLATQAKIKGTSLNSLVSMDMPNITKWDGATLNLNTNLQLDAITTASDFSGLVANINSKISADPTLNGKIVASYDTATNSIKFANNSGSDISLTAKDSNNGSLAGLTNIAKGSSITISATDATKWSKANLTFGNTITLDPTIADTDANHSGNTVDEIIANINNKLSQNSILNGKVSASYVNDTSGSYIKFTNASSSSVDLTITASASNGSTNLGSITGVNGAVSSSTTLSNLGITSSSNLSFKLSYDSATTTTPIEIDATSTDTLKTIADKVNSQTNGAVIMSIDDTTGQISFQTKKYGSASNLTIKDNGNLSALGIAAGSNLGQDAIVSITEPGKSAVTTTQSSNKFIVNGVSYSLVNIGSATATVTGNSDAVVNNIKNFITDYNTIIAKINTKLTEKKNSAYPPLTDAQKASMSDSQISAWEAKAKVGILRNDDNLSSMMERLRGIFSSPVYNNYTGSGSSSNSAISLSFGQYGTNAIGIDTSKNIDDAGQLVVQDDSKLKDAIENHFDDFKKMFIGSSSDTLAPKQSYVGSSKYMEDGLFTRMNTILKDYVSSPGIGEDGTYTLAGSMNIFVNKQYDYGIAGSSSQNTIPDQIYRQTSTIAKLKTQMSDAEERYYAKFSALESAMTTLNSQQSSLSSMLGTN